MNNNVPIESPRKYGTFDEVDERDADDIASMLAGGEPRSRVRTGAVSQLPDSDEVDANFLRNAGNSDKHYGG